MAMKSSTVRGTPVRHITNTAREGMGAQSPAGFSGTVNQQFEGDKLGARNGTPYHSHDGNGPEFKRERSHGKYGEVRDQNGDQNNPRDNGDGVILDKISRDGDYLPMQEGTMDSPVPHGAPTLAKGEVHRENIAHLGQGIGAHPSQAGGSCAD